MARQPPSPPRRPSRRQAADPEPMGRMGSMSRRGPRSRSRLEPQCRVQRIRTQRNPMPAVRRRVTRRVRAAKAAASGVDPKDRREFTLYIAAIRCSLSMARDTGFRRNRQFWVRGWRPAAAPPGARLAPVHLVEPRAGLGSRSRVRLRLAEAVKSKRAEQERNVEKSAPRRQQAIISRTRATT